MLRLPRALHRDFAGMWHSCLCLKTTLELAPFSALRWESCRSTAGQQALRDFGDSLLTHSLRAGVVMFSAAAQGDKVAGLHLAVESSRRRSRKHNG